MNHVPVTQSLRDRKPYSVGNFDPDSVGCCLVACTSNLSSHSVRESSSSKLRFEAWKVWNDA
jgi:hypothetical protein